MAKFIQIHWTASHLDEAREISEGLVMNRLVACSTIIPLVESCYIWDNELQTSSEVKVISKTVEPLFESVKAFIEKGHSYEVPEIIMIRIAKGNEAYLKWIENQVKIPSLNGTSV